jgi:hypothetical protein
MNAAGSKPLWLGTQRYGFGPAPPGGLTLVQDFLNRRMKQCRNPLCRATFYDSSSSNRGVLPLHPTSVTERR